MAKRTLSTSPDGAPVAHAIDRVLVSVLQHPWALTPAMIRTMAGILAARVKGSPLDASALVPRPAPPPGPSPAVAVVGIHGVIAPRINLLSEISGGATYESITADVREALAAGASTIVLDIASPGGSVAGCAECAAVVRAARDRARVIAVANYEMNSAAYWIGAQAHEIIASPSALVGSIGVYTVHEDLSELFAAAGIKVTYISAGDHKVEGNPAEALSDYARGRMTAIVETMRAQFVADVALGRGTTTAAVLSSYGQGDVYTASEARALGLVDDVATLDEVLARLTLPAPSFLPGARSAAAGPVPHDVPHEPARVTGIDRARRSRELVAEILALEFTA